MNLSGLKEEFWNNELGEALNLANATKREAAQDVVFSLLPGVGVPGSYLLVIGSIQEAGIAGLTLSGTVPPLAIALALGMFLVSFGLYFYFVVVPPLKLWYDPTGKVYMTGGT